MTASAVRPCEPADVPAVMEAFQTLYGANPRLQERDYIDWQFRDTPFTANGSYHLWLLEEERELKGLLGYVPLEFRTSAGVECGCWTLTWHYGGVGTGGVQLLSRVMAEYDHRFHVGLTPESVSVYSAYRIPVGTLPRWVGILEPDKVMKRFEITEKADRDRLGTSARQLSGGNVPELPETGERFEPEYEFRFEGLWGASVRRSGNYLNWRYIDIPKHSYRIVRDENGFCVFRIENIKGCDDRVIRILEWGYEGQSSEETMLALAAVGRNEGAILLDFFTTSRVLGTHVEAMGLFGSRTMTGGPIPHQFRPTNHAPDIQMAIDFPPHRKPRRFPFDSWYITKGDSDIDREKL
ncbi:MAG: hypothetical protein CME26_03020 [Gemmatimonadetes bacterium]|nr:hypothetical protein [Gemmatimonadota bacterium]|tara:strand:- start:11192 stop:12247 length:1056 start_codon:yes stop_codon:yes gene_type:complete